MYCCVADVAGMDLWVEEGEGKGEGEGEGEGERRVGVVVCGVGMDVWSVPVRGLDSIVFGLAGGTSVR